MNENDGSTARGFDPDTAPDLSKDGWPEKFAKAPVRRGRPGRRGQRSPPPSGCPPRSSTHFRAGGRGWQTRIDDVLRDWIKQHDVG
ncbi:BrnA antitoxin family protein [Candidatus Palauibacter sp.]|uniref:BrnA antitoxin family protein n=1 Tax=Candidatus Palauibacter sp. TaxID=3101350 RepID=UPI003AF28EEA